MNVIERGGRKVLFMFDKITARTRELCYGLHNPVDSDKLAMLSSEGVYDEVTVGELHHFGSRKLRL